MIKRIIKATILLILLLPANLPAAMDFIFEESISKSMARMETLYTGGQWDEAMKVGRGIIKDAPKDHPAARRAQDLIILSLDGRNNEIFANQKRDQLKKQTETGQQLITEGSKLLTEKNYSAAAEKFSRAVRMHGADAQSYFLYGYASLKADKRKDAYNALQQCLKLNPSHERALFHIAGLSYEFNQSTEAEDYAARLIEAIEKKLNEYRDIFQDQRSREMNDKAVATARRMAALRNNLGQAAFMHGMLAQKRKDYKTAVVSFEKATKINPSSADNWFRLGSCFLQLKVYHQATISLEQSILIRETLLKELTANAGKLLDAGQSDAAVDAELKTRKLKEEIARSLYVLAIANGRTKETDSAIRNIERAIELKPDFVQGRFTRAILLAEKNNLEEALEQMRQVLKDSPPKSVQAKKAIKTITFLMDQIARRDNPTEIAAVENKQEQMVEVDQYVKDMPGIGGKTAETRLEDVFPKLREVKQLVAMRNHAEAVRRLLYLRSQHPDIAEIHAILGHCYMEMGRINDAAKCFEDAIVVQPDHGEALNGLAYIMATKAENLDIALKYVNQALAVDGLRAEFHHTLGWVQFKTGEIRKSIDAFTRALEIKPGYLLARYNLGLANYLTQSYPAAIAAFNAVLALNPGHHKALLFKAISLAKTQNAEEAIATLESLRGKLSEKSVLGKVVVDLHARLKLAHERHAELPVPEIKSPAPIERLMAEAAAFRAKGLVTRAKEKYLECQRLAPERFEPHFELGDMYAVAGLNIPALASWERAEKLKADHFPLQMSIGKMHHKLGRPDKAREYFDRAQALNEKDPEPRYYLGLLAYEEKRFESAESYSLAALRLKPDYFKSMALLGMARIRLNRIRPARDIYETLYAKAPADSSIRRHARKKLWEITRMMAPSQYPSVEDAYEVKSQMVRKVTDADKKVDIKPTSQEETAIAEYGKNTMTLDDKMWVLKQLERFGSVSTPTPIAPIRREVTAQTLTSKDKQWVIKKLQGLGDRGSKYSLPAELKTEKFSLKTTEKPVTRKADPADAQILKALESAEKGFTAEAVAILAKARESAPKHLEVLLNLGFMHTVQGNFKDAFEAYANVTVAHPKEPLGRLALGNLYWLGGQADKALEQWRLIKGTCKPDSEFNILKRSEKIWQRLLEVDPMDADSHSNLGLVYMFSGEHRKALAEFQAVTSIDPARREHEFYQAQINVLMYVQKSNSNNRKEAEKLLEGLARGPEAFPHSERLKNFVANL